MTQIHKHNLYKEQKALTTNMKNVMLLLHDAMLKNFRAALKEVKWGDYEESEKKIKKNKKIILEICCFIRKEGEKEITDNLRKLYLFAYGKLELEKVKNNPKILEDLQVIIQTLKEGWQGMDLKTNQEQPVKMGASIIC